MTLQQLMNHFFALYGPRNRVFLNSLSSRIGFLSIAVVDLGRALRKQVAPDLQMLAVTRVVSRIFCVAEYYGNCLPFLDTLCHKYSSVCRYCLRSECICGPDRPSPQLAIEIDPAALDWSLTQWCRHLDQVYGASNTKLAVEALVAHLHEEVIEMLSLTMKSPTLRLPADAILANTADELADAFGWSIAIANRIGGDLETCLTGRYYPACWKCQKLPCECGPFSHEQVDWHQLSNP